MVKLTSELFERAKNFLKEYSRKIDLRLFEYYFESGSVDSVLNVLQTYQNHDGGFGNGIEPDFRLKSSSPMATTIAMQYLRELNVSSDNELVQRAIKYFLNTFDHEKRLWHGVPKETNNEPHAPWWHYNEDQGRSPVEQCWGNPNAEIVGYLHQYSELVPQDFLHMITDVAIEELKKLPDKMEMHEMLCYLRMAETLPLPQKSQVLEKLRKTVRQVASLDPNEWKGYSAKPLWFAPTPKSPVFELIKDEVELNLDYEIQNQSEEGSWTPNWFWGQYEEAWKQAEQEWKGYLTVKTLKSLHDYGRVEIISH